MGQTYSLFFPPPPPLTEANVPDQAGKTFLVTGGTGGVGLELCRLLYHAGGKVYMAGRSASKAAAAIAQLTAEPSAQPGEVHFLEFELADLSTIKPAVERFVAAEERLDVVFLNAGVSQPAPGSVGAQGHDLTMVTNCYGHHLLAQLLVPQLVKTARATKPGAVRIVWTSSMMTDLSAPKGGMTPEDLTSTDGRRNYTTSKTGAWFQAHAFARQVGEKGVLSIVQNPGNLRTDILRNIPAWIGYMCAPFFHPARYGAYTAAWTGLSPELTIADGGKFVLPWGRLHPNPRQDILDALKEKDEGGTGIAALFIDQCEKATKGFL